MKNIEHPFIRVAGICSILAPTVLLVGDLLLISAGLMFEWTIALWLAFVLFVPAIFGLMYILFENGSRLAMIGGLCAFFGAMAGASMQILFRVYAVLIERGAEPTVELLRNTFKLIATTQMIGIFFPIGLILLAVSVYQTKIYNRIIPSLLILGAVLFPIGRIGGFAEAVLGSGVFLLAAFAFIGWQMLARTESTTAQKLSRVAA